MYKVYIKTDEANRITDVNSDAFFSDHTGWVEIDEGEGDRYHHAQGNYFDKPIYEEHGIPAYKLVGGQVVERTQAEIAADIAAMPPAPPTPEERIAELEATIDALLGVQNG